MSFIYATKVPYDDFGQERENVQIFSETMITPRDTNGFQWGKRTLELVKRYGLIKSMILSPKSCFSFAGNDIRYANIFLDRLYKKRNCSDEELIELAFSVHKEAGPDAIEFIIFTADDEDPKSKELDDQNAELIMNLIKEELADNQVFIASIYDFECENRISINSRAIESR